MLSISKPEGGYTALVHRQIVNVRSAIGPPCLASIYFRTLTSVFTHTLLSSTETTALQATAKLGLSISHSTTCVCAYV